MDAFPHRYSVDARATPGGDVEVDPEGAATLSTNAPPQFGGPGDRWSPETLLTAAVADCFVLSFRAVAGAAKLDWSDLACTATGTLDRRDRTLAFTGFEVSARLTVPAGSDHAAALRCLERAERSCLVSRSLAAPVHLQPEVIDA